MYDQDVAAAKAGSPSSQVASKDNDSQWTARVEVPKPFAARGAAAAVVHVRVSSVAQLLKDLK